MVDESSSDRDPVEVLAEEYMERLRQGEQPSISEYTSRYPDLAGDIESIFPALAMMDEIDPSAGELSGSVPPVDEALPKLEKLGDYRIIREVGRGGMGVVYEAEQVSLGRHVALKVLPSAALPDNKHVRRFEREAKSAAKLHHTNIVPVFGVGEQDGLHYYVMQFIQGLPLDEVIDELKKIQAQPTGMMTSTEPVEKTGPFDRQHSVAEVAHSLITGQFAETYIGDSDSEMESLDATPGGDGVDTAEHEPSVSRITETLNLSGSTDNLGKSGVLSASRKQFTYWQSVANIGVQVADALHYAHDQAILHRDIKPSNLLLDLRGATWVTDFGLAKATDQQDITHTGDILGTLRYMPPEAFDGIADARSDVYSLGLTLYEMLVFQPAFGMKERRQLIKQVTTESAPRLDKLNPQIPRDLVTIVHKAIDRDPAHRYQTAEEMQDDLQRFIDDEPIKARRISLTERLARWSRRNKGLATSLATVGVLLLIINIAGPLMYLRLQDRNEELEANKKILTQTIEDLEAAEGKVRVEKQEALRARDDARQSATLVLQNLAYRWLTTPGRYLYGQDLLDRLQHQVGANPPWEHEYHLIRSLPDPNPGRILHRFSRDATGVAYSPGGEFIAAIDIAGSLLVLDAETGTVLRRFTGIKTHSHKVVWSPDGSRLALAEAHGNGLVWIGDVKTGLVRHFSTGSGRAGCLAWSPDGTRLVTGGVDGVVQIWDAQTWQLQKTFTGHKGQVRDVDWSCDDRLASCGYDRKVIVWDLQTGESISVGHEIEQRAVSFRSVNFSPDGKRLAAARTILLEDSVVIWDVESGEELLSLPVTTHGLSDVKWSHDSTRVATATRNSSTIEIWDLETEQRLYRFIGYASPTPSCSWSPDDRHLAACEGDTVRVWDLNQGEKTSDFAGNQQIVRELTWSPSGREFATAGADGTVYIWDVRTRRKLCVFEGHQVPVNGVAWNPHDNRLVSYDPKTLYVWEWGGRENPSEIKSIKEIPIAGTDEYLSDIVWSPDGTELAAALHVHNNNPTDGMVRAYDAVTFEELRQFPLRNAFSVSWERGSDAESTLLAAAGSFAVKVWNGETKDELLSYSSTGESYFRVSLSADGSQAAFSGSKLRDPFDELAGSDPVLGILDLKSSGEKKQSLLGHEARVYSICWMSDGSRLLTAGIDGTAILWDTANANESSIGQQILTLDELKGNTLYSASFSPDDMKIALVGTAPGVRLLDATPSYDALPGYSAQLSEKLLRQLDRRISEKPTVDDFHDLVFRGRILAKRGELKQAEHDFKRAAALRKADDSSPPWFDSAWWVTGPYPEPLADQPPPEFHLDLLEPIPSVDSVAWTALPMSTALNLGDYVDGAEHVSVYALTRIYAVEQQTVGLLMGADDKVQVWLNGSLVHRHAQDRAAVRDDDVVEMTLKPGWNSLLFQVTNNAGDHGLFARLSNEPRELSQAFEAGRKWKEALYWLDLASSRYPDDPAILLSLGRAALKNNQPQLAEESFNRACDLLELPEDKVSGYRRIAEWYLDDVRSSFFSAPIAELATSLERSREYYGLIVQSEFADSGDARGLAEVLLTERDLSSSWRLLEPEQMISAGGATLTMLADGSILASGVLPEKEVYTITALPRQKTITSFALETSPHHTMPRNGSGRHPTTGSFVISNVAVAIRDATGDEHEIPITGIAGDVASEPGRSNSFIENMIGRGRSTYWWPGPNTDMPYRMVFELEDEDQIIIPDAGALQITIDCSLPNANNYALGRFRLSVSDSTSAFHQAQQQGAILTSTDGWGQLAAAYELLGEERARDALLDRWPAAIAGIVDLYIDAADWTEAIAWLNKAIESDATNPDLIIKLAEISTTAGQSETVADECQKLIDSLRASGSLQKFSDELNWRVDAFVKTNELSKAIETLQLLLRAEPDSYDLILKSGNLYARMGQWRKAADDLTRAIELDQQETGAEAKDRSLKEGTGTGPRYALAPLLAELQDVDGYCKHCREYLKQFHDASDLEAGRALTACLWLPDTLTQTEWEAEDELANRTMGILRRANVKGMYFYRAGRIKEALKWIPKGVENCPPAEKARALFFWAMALHERGEAGDERLAQAKLTEAETLLRSAIQQLRVNGSLDVAWHDWVACRVLRREAVELIGGKEGRDRVAVEDHSDNAILLGKRKRWNEALSEQLQAIELLPDEAQKDDTMHWLRAAPLAIFFDDLECYRRLCSSLLQHYDDEDIDAGVFERERIIKICLLRPDLVDDMQRVYALEEGAVADDPTTGAGPFYGTIRALTIVRGGREGNAIETAKQNISNARQYSGVYLPEFNRAVLALAYIADGEREQARKELEQVGKIIDASLTRDDDVQWHDLLIAEILRREAEQLIKEGADHSAAPQKPAD